MNLGKIPPGGKAAKLKPIVLPEKQPRTVEKGKSPQARAAAAKPTGPQIPQKQRIKRSEKTLELKKEVEEGVNALRKMYPNEPFDFDVLAQLNNSPKKMQKEFVQKVNEHLAAKQAEPKGWREWLGSIVTSLKDRAVTRYEYGMENINFLAGMFREYGEVGMWMASVGIGLTKQEFEENYITGSFLQLTNQALTCAGNIALSTATMTLPFMAEWGTIIAALATGVYDAEHPEEINEEARQLKKCVEDYLNASTISERPVQDLTAYVVDSFQSWVIKDFWKKFAPLTILARQGDVASVLTQIAQGGAAVLPELLVLFILTSEFGPQPHPLVRVNPALASELAPIPGQLSSLQIYILTTLIVTLFKTGDLPIKKSLMTFLLEGPASFKALGLKGFISNMRKMVLKTMRFNDPILDPVFAYFLIKMSKQLFVKPTKQIVEKAVEQTLTYTGKAILKSEEEEKIAPPEKPKPQAAPKVAKQPMRGRRGRGLKTRRGV